MLIRLSIVNDGGVSIVQYCPKDAPEFLIEDDLISGFMHALQLFSEMMGAAIKEIVLSNIVVYIKTYGAYTIRILCSEKREQEEMEEIFNAMSKIAIEIIPLTKSGLLINDDIINQKIIPPLSIYFPELLKSFINEANEDTLPPTKIAIIGLGKAGKSSIKNMVFNRWTESMLENIQPTIDIEYSRKKLNFLNRNFLLMDFGGQQAYREEYLKNDLI